MLPASKELQVEPSLIRSAASKGVICARQLLWKVSPFLLLGSIAWRVLRASSVSSGASTHTGSVELFYAAYRDESFIVLGHIIVGGW